MFPSDAEAEDKTSLKQGQRQPQKWSAPHDPRRQITMIPKIDPYNRGVALGTLIFY